MKTKIVRNGPKLEVKGGTFADLLEEYKTATGRNYSWIGQKLGLSQQSIYGLRVGKPVGQDKMWLMAELLGQVQWSDTGPPLK